MGVDVGLSPPERWQDLGVGAPHRDMAGQGMGERLPPSSPTGLWMKAGQGRVGAPGGTCGRMSVKQWDKQCSWRWERAAAWQLYCGQTSHRDHLPAQDW